MNLYESVKARLNEAPGDRYQIRKYDGVGAPYGIWDTQAKKFVHKGEKEAYDKDGNRKESPLERECRKRNEKDKASKLKESDSSYETILDKAIEIEDYNGNTIMGFLVGADGKIEKYYDCDIADEDDDYLFNSGKNLVRIQSNRNGGDMFEEAESGDLWEKIDNLMYKLLHNNKNYNKEQYYGLLELEELLEEVRKGPKKESALNEREEERAWSEDGKYLNMKEMVARALESAYPDTEFTDEGIEFVYGTIVDEDPYMEEIFDLLQKQAMEIYSATERNAEEEHLQESKVTEKQYMCNDCGLAFDEDELTSIDDEGNDLCPACGSTNITDTGR